MAEKTDDQTEEPSSKTDEPENEKPPDLEEPQVPAPVTALGRLQDFVYYAIAAILLVLSAGSLVHAVIDFFAHDEAFVERVTGVVHEVLFVVITLELLRTVLAHFEDSSFQLKPFMIIGIISAVRHILTVGAELSLQDERGEALFHRSDIELGVNALVVLVLVIGLVLIRETE